MTQDVIRDLTHDPSAGLSWPPCPLARSGVDTQIGDQVVKLGD
jgi:hypothetical protein